jgi:predicted RecA/RadA family phage recombinase
MATNYQQIGEVVQHTAGANITSGQVVKMGNILGVALQDIGNGETGPVMVKGVFVVPKVTAAVIAQGESLTWDVSVSKFDDNAATPATGDVTGAAAFAFEAAGNGATELAVCFTGVPGTVT